MNQNEKPPSSGCLPLLDHPLDQPTAFRPEDLVAAVRLERGRGIAPVPAVCVLEFDGDLTDKLLERGELARCEQWPCFHTTMWRWESDGRACGIVARTIGGPYTVLVAEQLAVCGAKLIVGLASAGRLTPTLPLPALVLADEAIRDEGTSYHYLPPADTVEATPGPLKRLGESLRAVGLPFRQGLIWTTDAPYRETKAQVQRHADKGALAVEMQAASLFAFGRQRNVPVALVAHVTNAIDHTGEQFGKGPEDIDVRLLRAICQGAQRWLADVDPAGATPL